MCCVRVINQTFRKARKEHFCMLNEYVGNVYWPSGKLSFSELRALVRYERNNRRIMKGELYVRQFNEHEGDTYVWIAHKEIWDILNRHGLYECEC